MTARLNSFIRTGAMECEVPLSILPDIPSNPEALLVSKASRRLNTSSSVQKSFHLQNENYISVHLLTLRASEMWLLSSLLSVVV